MATHVVELHPATVHGVPLFTAKRRKLRRGETLQGVIASGIHVACNACGTLPGVRFTSHPDIDAKQWLCAFHSEQAS
ncbi:MAG: hypothetical protein O7G88_01185 [bacterium]|nr:hypothetical protein [bacterium]